MNGACAMDAMKMFKECLSWCCFVATVRSYESYCCCCFSLFTGSSVGAAKLHA